MKVIRTEESNMIVYRNLLNEVHREDGTKEYWVNGKLHRIDGPAVEYPDGTKKWYINDELHREDGPALELPDGNVEYFLQGEPIDEADFENRVAELHSETPQEEAEVWPKVSEYTPGITCKEYKDGTKHYFNADGQLHREDGPAYDCSDGQKEWWIDGKKHREDGPAVEYPSGTKEWWMNGDLHREDGPAVEGRNGYKAWYINGKRHRIDGPAFERGDGTKAWWVYDYCYKTEGIREDGSIYVESKTIEIKNAEGLLHNESGPANIESDGSMLWYIDGKKHREDGPAIERPGGYKQWAINGKKHRVDGPAVESADGCKEWWVNGELHRLDGPAIEQPEGVKEWYVNGKRHRIDGPAIEYADSSKSWYLDDEYYGEEAYWQELKNRGLVQEEEVVEEIWPKVSEYAPGITCKECKDGTKNYLDVDGQFHREDGPAIECPDGTKFWCLNGDLHREDGPAIEYPDGTKEYWMNGKLHREDGPAIERPDGTKEWYINGEQIEKKDSRWGKLLIDATQASLAICLTAYLSSGQTQETEQNLAPEEEICTEWGGHIVLPVSQMENA